MDINFENFKKFKIAVGTITSVNLNKKARIPAYIISIDFGEEIGRKISSAQLTNYSPENLLKKQVIAVVNFPIKKIAGISSEVLILGALVKDNVRIIQPDINVKNGTFIL